MQDPMVVVSRNGRIQAANHPFTSLADVEEKSLVEKKIWDYLEIREEGRKHFLGRGQAITGMVCHLKAGTRPELMVSVLKIPQVDQENPSYVFILRDISKQKWLAEMIRYNATHDSLTGLANRAFFLRKLENLVKSSKNEKNGFAAVLFISLDRFKYINDSYGHRFGDAVLRAFSERIRHLVRDGDAVSRLGGDEFIVLFENLKSEGEAWRIALQLHQKLSRPFSIEWKEISLESSIGITCDWQDFEDVSQILGNADLAMREAKRKTSEKVVLYTESMRSQTRALFFLESDLRSAIKNKTIDIHFQPITCMVEKNLRGFEVLARWDHPEYGMIPPSLFIPLAERVGLIEPLEWIIFEKVFAKRQKWRQKFPGRPFYLAVNVSGFQLGRISFPVYIGRSFQQFGICPGEIVFEVTESMLMQNPTVAKRVLGELKKAGAKLALDDFGTGYSSLSHLSSFPFDFLKIDQSFVRGACKNPESHHGEIIETISQLGHSLGMEVVVEGVETDQDMERVSVLGIDAWQGFLSSVPTDAAGAELILQESHFFKKENYFAMSS
jgi:diguanylate cyclase (GGDEF)-like protein/PAS domain S-box-containing protein